MSPEGNDAVCSHWLAAQSLLISDRSQQVSSHKVAVMVGRHALLLTPLAFGSGQMGGIRRRQRGVSLLWVQLRRAETEKAAGCRCRYGLQQQHNITPVEEAMAPFSHCHFCFVSTLPHSYLDLLEDFQGFWLIVHTIICWICSLKPAVFLPPLMPSGFPPHAQWEGRASLGVILLEESSPELPHEPALQSPTGDHHTSGKCTKPISSGLTFQLKEPALIAFCSSCPASSSSLAVLCGAGTLVALVLLAFIGAVVCIRISRPTLYTVCTWCEDIKHFYAHFSLSFSHLHSAGDSFSTLRVIKNWYLSRFIGVKTMRVNHQLKLLASVCCCTTGDEIKRSCKFGKTLKGSWLSWMHDPAVHVHRNNLKQKWEINIEGFCL